MPAHDPTHTWKLGLLVSAGSPGFAVWDLGWLERLCQGDECRARVVQ